MIKQYHSSGFPERALYVCRTTIGIEPREYLVKLAWISELNDPTRDRPGIVIGSGHTARAAVNDALFKLNALTHLALTALEDAR